MEILEEKPGTKRPVIVRAATSLFARRGVDATSMRDIADAAGVREAAIYRHFSGKDAMALEIFASWYGWYSRQVQEIVNAGDSLRKKVRALVQVEFAAARAHPQEFLYFCENDAVLVSPDGKRVAGIAEVRRSYETEFALFHDAHCDLRVCTGNNGRGVAESYFTGTRKREKRIEAIGAEVMEIVDGKIKEIRDYHHAVPAKAA